MKAKDMKEFTDSVKSYALQEGADLVGIAPVSRYEGAPHMLRPQAHLPEARTVIVMAIHHPDASVEWGSEPNSNYSGGFQIGMIPKLDTMALRVARFVEKQGYAAVPLSCTFYWRHRKYKDVNYDHAASFSHMNAFVAAGLGEYGWHGMVMSPKYGPRQRIISVITSAPLLADPLYNGESLCDRCKQCEKACWGMNYKPEYLLEPKTISFSIESKKFEYANVNRWRCFWGEQCHLDMNHLAKQENLGEQEIYDAMEDGVKRTGVGGAGYMCSSFKYCMSEPVRQWDKKYTSGPRRRKTSLSLSANELRNIILEKAKACGADRCAIQPISSFENLKDGFYEGFRTEDLFKTFRWVVTLGREIPICLSKDGLLAQKNDTAFSMARGRMMAGILDIARQFDDSGLEAMQTWGQSGFSGQAAKLAGWADKFKYPAEGQSSCLTLESVVCNASLSEEIISIPGELDDIAPQDIVSSTVGRLPHVDLIGMAKLRSLEFPTGKELQKLIPQGRTLIAIAVEMPERVVELAGLQEAECSVSYQYVSYHATKEAFWAAHDIASSLAAKGHFALPLLELDSSAIGRSSFYGAKVPDLHAQSPFAAAAGLGILGKSGLLITSQFGPRQRLAFVVTSADLPEKKIISKEPVCPEGCVACAEKCRVKAIDTEKAVEMKISAGRSYPVFERNKVRCEWARSLGMIAGEGSDLLGWKLPALPIPDKLDDNSRKVARDKKDPIQRLCYCNPNHSDTQVERCLQACPLGRAGKRV
ncbi:MAG TPA: hypothetical protein DCZ94_08925 [Lentisphaeria bacterium]|nr:MAG: hypothetical protein A2X48_23480 [Lentisphaerae bacterium GWF2_49_21]HBC87063.1 hypothetical protein [Lentisphaeria bacterium]